MIVRRRYLKLIDSIAIILFNSLDDDDISLEVDTESTSNSNHTDHVREVVETIGDSNWVHHPPPFYVFNSLILVLHTRDDVPCSVSKSGVYWCKEKIGWIFRYKIGSGSVLPATCPRIRIQSGKKGSATLKDPARPQHRTICYLSPITKRPGEISQMRMTTPYLRKNKSYYKNFIILLYKI